MCCSRSCRAALTAQSQFAVADNDTASMIELTSTSDTPAREPSPRHSYRSQAVTGRSQTQTLKRAVSAAIGAVVWRLALCSSAVQMLLTGGPPGARSEGNHQDAR
jgi:hypothetical protein